VILLLRRLYPKYHVKRSEQFMNYGDLICELAVESFPKYSLKSHTVQSRSEAKQRSSNDWVRYSRILSLETGMYKGILHSMPSAAETVSMSGLELSSPTRALHAWANWTRTRSPMAAFLGKWECSQSDLRLGYIQMIKYCHIQLPLPTAPPSVQSGIIRSTCFPL
jgi:hypothetical protein